MKILVFSDSHGSVTEMINIIKNEKSVDLILHLGDFKNDIKIIKQKFSEKKFEYVAGNCDYLFDKKEAEKIITINNKKILLCHGHRYNVKRGLSTLKNYAKSKEIDIALYGHTHEPDIDISENLYIINPGSISKPRATKYGTYAKILIDDNNRIDVSIESANI